MRTFDYNLSNGTFKEIHFSLDNINDIKKAEKVKSRLENKGYTLFKEASYFGKAKLIYKSN